MNEAVDPGSRFRGTVAGELVGGTSVTTAVEVARGGNAVVLKLVDDDLFVVALAAPDVAHMITAAQVGEISYVSAEHSRHGRVLLGVRPHVVGADALPDPMLSAPLAVYLELPGCEPCEVLLDPTQSAELVRHLIEGLRLIGPPALGE
jgi:hypothetical protein